MSTSARPSTPSDLATALFPDGKPLVLGTHSDSAFLTYAGQKRQSRRWIDVGVATSPDDYGQIYVQVNRQALHPGRGDARVSEASGNEEKPTGLWSSIDIMKAPSTPGWAKAGEESEKSCFNKGHRVSLFPDGRIETCASVETTEGQRASTTSTEDLIWCERAPQRFLMMK